MPTVLVVDDDRNIRTVLERQLTRRGYTCVLCASAEEAAEAYPSQPVDAILLDLRLPGADGYTFLRDLQREHGRVPVIIMTGAGTMDDAVTAVRLRASDFLQKPFRDEELADAVALAIRERATLSSGELPAYGGAPSPGPGGAQTTADDGERGNGGGETRRVVQTVLSAFKEVERRLGAGRISLPVLDARVGRVQGLMQRPVCGVDEVLDLVGSDQTLAATCLRAANSSLYNTGQPIRSLRQACVQLGNRRVMAFASEALVHGAFSARREPFGTIMADLWRSALVTARVAEHLARLSHRASVVARAALPSLDELHVAALLHNIGELLLLQLLAQLPDFRVESATALAVLGEAIHARHESFGGKLARRWALPKHVVSLAGGHHRPAVAKETDGETLVRHLVLAAWAVALRGGFTYLPAPAPPEPDEYLATICVDPEQIEPLYEQMAGWLEELEPAA